VQSAGALVLPAEEVRITLLQAVRELLFNVVKHAGVREASIVVEAHGNGRIQVTVSDKGAGFDAARIAPLGDAGAGTASSGIGLFSIRERLALTGGGIGVESSPGRGSKVTIWVPDDMPTDPQPLPEETIRLLLVDDHAVVRDGLALQLRGQQGIEVVGTAADGESAVQLAGSLRPDVVTMDVGMPGMSGVEAARRIHASYPDVAIIGLSMFDDPAQEAAMRKAGASAYLTKSASLPTLVAAIRSCRRTSTASSSKR
jgi:CheY-like chemotaxis protein